MPFKVIVFGTHRKPVCDLLLVNNTNLHHTSRIIVELLFSKPSGQIVAYDWGCLQLMHPFSLTNALNTRFFGVHSCYRQYRCIFKHLDLTGPKVTEFSRITRQSDGNYAVQHHAGSLILVQIESRYATFY